MVMIIVMMVIVPIMTMMTVTDIEHDLAACRHGQRSEEQENEERKDRFLHVLMMPRKFIALCKFITHLLGDGIDVRSTPSGDTISLADGLSSSSP
jgi:hypothetical protein